MAKAITEVGIGAAALGAAFLVPGGGIALGSMILSHGALAGALASIGSSAVMSGIASALRGNQGGLAVGVTTPIGPWGYVYGTQKVGGVEIFRESNSNTGASGSTSNDKQLHRVYALACHPCSIGNFQLRIDGKQVLLRASGTDWVSYTPTQTQIDISSISRTNGIVTMVLSSPMPAGTDGTTLQVRSVADNSYNGTWIVTQPNPQDFTTWTYVCGGPNSTTSGGNARTTYSDYKDKIRVSFLNGSHTTTFQTLLEAGTTWSSTDLCLGRTLAYVQMGYDDTVFPSSIPNVSFVIDGKNDILDPRTNTRGFTKNPALIIADYLSMLPELGGFGLTIGTDIPTASLIAAANICDETMLLNTGGTTAQYTCNTFFQLNTPRGTILKDLLSSCSGRISYQGGTYSIFPGAWVAPTLQLTDADLVGPIKWNPRLSIRDTCNGVKGTYISPENAYQQADIPPYMCDAEHGYVSDVYLAEDNGERIFKEVNFPCTDNSGIAQRLAKIALMRTRFQGRGTIRCSLKAYQATALDTIQLTHAHYGWEQKTFEVLSSRVNLCPGDNQSPYVDLDIAETDPSVYEWTPTEQLTPEGYVQPNNVGVRICMPPEQVIGYSGPGALVNGYQCPSTITYRADGSETNSIYVAWTQPNDANVILGGHMEVQYQLVGASGWSSMGKIDPSTSNAFIPNVSDGASYNVQVRAVNTAGVPSDWIQATPYPVVVSDTARPAPQQVTNVSAVESPYKTASGQMMSLVAVDFTPAANDPLFYAADIYFTGYNGSSVPQLMNKSTASPAQFLVDTTHEVVVVTVVAVSADGVEADFASAPTCTLSLNGVVSAPPAPSIYAAQTALQGGDGWQFAFNVIGGLEADLIQTYRIYHSESDSTPTPLDTYYFKSYPQPATNVGQITVQELAVEVLYYWVSAVSTSGLESQLTPVPFAYQDPNNPAPPVPSPVQTAKNYYPTTLLNGWGTGAHVGYWETEDSANGTTFGLSNTQTAGPYSNPQNAFDGNQNTAASYSGTHHAAYAGCVWSFAGYVNTATVSAVNLNIVSEVLPTAGPVHGEASIWYSLDNGSTWTQVYLVNYLAGGTTRIKQTDTVTLPATTDPTKLQVMACAHSHDDIAHNVYEISLAVTQSGYAGPGKITGVAASLVNGNVQIVWNALLPTTRTDIASYQVYRAVHGAGYVNSYLHDTVTPNGASSYSWADSTAHDGSWDYWVIAEDVNGNYSPPSDVATLYSATSMLYSATGMTVESQQPLLGASPTVGAGPLGWPVAAQTTDATINYGDDVSGSATLPAGVNPTYFYVRWTGYLIASVTGSYTIGVNSDDGCNLYIGNVPLVQSLSSPQGANGSGAYTQSGTTMLQAGTYYPIVLEWQQGTGGDECQLLWTPPGGSIQLIPSANLSSSATSHTGGLTGQWWNGTSSLWYPTGSAYIDFNGSHPNKSGYTNTNITVSGGAIGGIGAGSGTLVANNLITLGSNGALSGAGGGQVTIGGLGYLGELNANNTAAHVLTATSVPANGVELSNLGMQPINNFGFSLTASGSSDVYNICAVLMVSGDSQADQVEFKVTDTTTGTDYGQVMYSIPASGIIATFPFFVSITGLTAGSHTLQFYGLRSSTSPTTMAGGTYAICQRIF